MSELDENEFTERPDLLRKRAMSNFLNKALLWVLAIWMICMMIATVILALQGAAQREILVDCTTPGRSCYERGQESDENAIRDTVRDTLTGGETLHVRTRDVVVMAAYCADKARPQTVAEIRRCIEQGLEVRR